MDREREKEGDKYRDRDIDGGRETDEDRNRKYEKYNDFDRARDVVLQ